jgi:hypothetical protein
MAALPYENPALSPTLVRLFPRFRRFAEGMFDVGNPLFTFDGKA